MLSNTILDDGICFKYVSYRRYMQHKFKDFELINLYVVNGLYFYCFDAKNLKRGFLISFVGNIAQLHI